MFDEAPLLLLLYCSENKLMRTLVVLSRVLGVILGCEGIARMRRGCVAD